VHSLRLLPKWASPQSPFSRVLESKIPPLRLNIFLEALAPEEPAVAQGIRRPRDFAGDSTVQRQGRRRKRRNGRRRSWCCNQSLALGGIPTNQGSWVQILLGAPDKKRVAAMQPLLFQREILRARFFLRRTIVRPR